MMKIEYPMPIEKDRHGKLSVDYTMKDWFAKLDEEVNELKSECLKGYTLEDKPGGSPIVVSEGAKLMIADEGCDVIKVVSSLFKQIGIDCDRMDEYMRQCNEKTRRRGYHD
jgi:hypothetical protein